MKTLLVILLAIPIFALSFKGDCPASMDDFKINFEEDTLVMVYKNSPSHTVRILPDFQLLLDGQNIALDSEQRELVKNYYLNVQELVDAATEMGLIGAKIGVESLGIGLRAITHMVAQLLLSEEKIQTTEKKLQEQEEKVKMKASTLEKMGDALEVKAKILEEMHCQLIFKIEALRKAFLK